MAAQSQVIVWGPLKGKQRPVIVGRDRYLFWALQLHRKIRPVCLDKMETYNGDGDDTGKLTLFPSVN